MTYEGYADISQAWASGLTPDPILTVSEWADTHRYLSGKSSAEPGRWRTARTPYLKEIMDCLSPSSPIERVVFMKAVQLGATECGNNWIGYIIHHSPGPTMSVSPTVDMAKRNSKQRIDPLIAETPVLASLIAPPRARDSGNTVLTKDFRGGVLVMTGANSAVGLRSMPVRYLFLDEVDGYPHDVDGEGDAISLAEARTRTFSRRKIFIVSTPTVAGVSAIEREYAASDQRRFFVPCPHCYHKQVLQFEQLRWTKGDPSTVNYHCINCSLPIQESHKTWLLNNGEWQATATGSNAKIAGFHLSSLYSPIGWRSWVDIAASWETASQGEFVSEAAIKTFKNTELGETWAEAGDAPEWQRLYDRREGYPIGIIPTGGLLLVAGADIQRNRIEVSVWAFGRGKESWLVEHRVFLGDTTGSTVWTELGAMLQERWPHQSGGSVPLVKLAVDTGYNTQVVYDFVRTQRDHRLIAIKGVSYGQALINIPTAIELARDGRRLKGGVKLYSVVGGIAKSEIYNNLLKDKIVGPDGLSVTYPPGYVHLPEIEAEFIQQLCAEQLVTRRKSSGFATKEWQLIRARNEALDCYVYARAAASVVGMDRFEEHHWADLERHLNPPEEEEPIVLNTPKPEVKEPTPAPVAKPIGRRIIRSTWLR